MARREHALTLRVRIGILAAALTALALLAAPASAIPASGIAGSTRYGTAAAISRSAFPSGAPAVVLAGGTAWPDALGGSALAGAAGGPVLLTESERLTAETRTELRRLAPTRVYLLGGTAALAPAVASQVASALPGAEIVRLAGRSRFLVSRAVASEVASVSGSAPERAFVVTGRSFADALACAAPAAAEGWPVVLVDPLRPAETTAAVAASGASEFVIVGGVNAVPAAIEQRLVTAYGRAAVTRIAERDRYRTAFAVARFAEAQAGLSLATPVLASGATPTDALAGGPLAAKRGSALVLTAPWTPESVAEELWGLRARVDSFTFLGGQGALPDRARIEAQHALRARPFSRSRAMSHVEAIAGFGPRGAGGTAERNAANYVAARLRDYGYAVTVQSVPIPGGRYSRNVVAELPGTAPGTIVLGAHIDSKPPSPGANDNASGVAVTLELARIMAEAEGFVPTIRFIGFGAEEIGGPTPNDHHFGSRYYVAHMSPSQRSAVEGMVSIDMVGYGDVFNIRNLRVAPMTVVGSLQSFGNRSGEPLPFLKDFGRSGWSDHEAFEFSGIPVAWLEWREDPVYHTTRDTASHVQASRVDRTGRLVRGWLLDFTPAELSDLR